MPDAIIFSAFLMSTRPKRKGGGGDLRLSLPSTAALAKMMVIPSSMHLKVTIEEVGRGRDDVISL